MASQPQEMSRPDGRTEGSLERFVSRPELYGVLAALSEEEVDLSSPVISNLEEYILDEESPLMAWAVVGPAPGLVVGCTTGLLVCPNSGPGDGDLVGRKDIRGHWTVAEERKCGVLLRDGSTMEFQLLEGETDLMSGYLRLLTTTRRAEQIRDKFDLWLDQLESDSGD